MILWLYVIAIASLSYINPALKRQNESHNGRGRKEIRMESVSYFQYLILCSMFACLARQSSNCVGLLKVIDFDSFWTMHNKKTQLTQYTIPLFLCLCPFRFSLIIFSKQTIVQVDVSNCFAAHHHHCYYYHHVISIQSDVKDSTNMIRYDIQSIVRNSTVFV